LLQRAISDLQLFGSVGVQKYLNYPLNLIFLPYESGPG